MLREPKSHDRVFAFDATNRISVLWFANPKNVVERFRREVEAIAEKFSPCRVACCFDVGRVEWRRELVPTYKATRAETKRELAVVLDEAIDESSRFSTVFAEEEWEADDYLASVAHTAKSYGVQCVLVTPDKDARQCLATGKVSILKKFSIGKTPAFEWVTSETHIREKQFPAERFVDWQTIVGDSTDGIAGWAGVGEVRASVWMRSMTLDDILANPWRVSLTAAQQRTFEQFKRDAAAMRECLRLRTNAPLVEEFF